MADLKDELHARQQQVIQHIHQPRFDEVGRQIGFRAPQRVLGQDPNDYRPEVLRTLKKTYLNHHDLNRVNMRGLDDSVLPQFEEMVLQAVVKEAHNPANVPLGEMRRLDKLDAFGKLQEIHWIGQECFVKQMGRPGRRVLSFTTPQGRWNARTGSWF
jgi:hypothetical protein